MQSKKNKIKKMIKDYYNKEFLDFQDQDFIGIYSGNDFDYAIMRNNVYYTQFAIDLNRNQIGIPLTTSK